jgi:hypothetical protein
MCADGISIMRALLTVGIASLVVSPGALADGLPLAGSLWHCTRASDRSQFVITFYPGGGVGGGEMQDGDVSPYVFDASGVKAGEWPGRWDQTGQRFTWSFPDQHMEISGIISSPGRPKAKLSGTEVASGVRSAISCTGVTKLPKIGEGLVIPKDGHFMDPASEDGELKVPAGISLQAPDNTR